MEEVFKIVFFKVEDFLIKIDDIYIVEKFEYQQICEFIQVVVIVVEGFQGDMKEYQFQIFEVVKDVFFFVGQYFEYFKSFVIDIQDKFVEVKLIE